MSGKVEFTKPTLNGWDKSMMTTVVIFNSSLTMFSSIHGTLHLFDAQLMAFLESLLVTNPLRIFTTPVTANILNLKKNKGLLCCHFSKMPNSFPVSPSTLNLDHPKEGASIHCLLLPPTPRMVDPSQFLKCQTLSPFKFFTSHSPVTHFCFN